MTSPLTHEEIAEAYKLREKIKEHLDSRSWHEDYVDLGIKHGECDLLIKIIKLFFNQQYGVTK